MGSRDDQKIDFNMNFNKYNIKYYVSNKVNEKISEVLQGIDYSSKQDLRPYSAENESARSHREMTMKAFHEKDMKINKAKSLKLIIKESTKVRKKRKSRQISLFSSGQFFDQGSVNSKESILTQRDIQPKINLKKGGFDNKRSIKIFQGDEDLRFNQISGRKNSDREFTCTIPFIRDKGYSTQRLIGELQVTPPKSLKSFTNFNNVRLPYKTEENRLEMEKIKLKQAKKEIEDEKKKLQIEKANIAKQKKKIENERTQFIKKKKQSANLDILLKKERLLIPTLTLDTIRTNKKTRTLREKPKPSKKEKSHSSEPNTKLLTLSTKRSTKNIVPQRKKKEIIQREKSESPRKEEEVLKVIPKAKESSSSKIVTIVLEDPKDTKSSNQKINLPVPLEMIPHNSLEEKNSEFNIGRGTVKRKTCLQKKNSKNDLSIDEILEEGSPTSTPAPTSTHIRKRESTKLNPSKMKKNLLTIRSSKSVRLNNLFNKISFRVPNFDAPEDSVSQEEADKMLKGILDEIQSADLNDNNLNKNIFCDDIDFQSKTYLRDKEYCVNHEITKISGKLIEVEKRRDHVMQQNLDLICEHIKEEGVKAIMNKKIQLNYKSYLNDMKNDTIKREDEKSEYIMTKALGSESIEYLRKDKVKITKILKDFLLDDYFEVTEELMQDFLNNNQYDFKGRGRLKKQDCLIKGNKLPVNDNHFTGRNFVRKRTVMVRSSSCIEELKKEKKLEKLLLIAETKIENILYLDEITQQDVSFRINNEEDSELSSIKRLQKRLASFKRSYPGPIKKNFSVQSIRELDDSYHVRRSITNRKKQISFGLVHEGNKNLIRQGSVCQSPILAHGNRPLSPIKGNGGKTEERGSILVLKSKPSQNQKVDIDKSIQVVHRAKKRKSKNFSSISKEEKQVLFLRKYEGISNKRKSMIQKNLFSAENKDITLLQTRNLKTLAFKVKANDIYDNLFYYIHEGNYNFAEKLIKDNLAFLNLNYQDDDGNSFLTIAVRYNYKNIIELLLKCGCDPNVGNVRIFLYNIQ